MKKKTNVFVIIWMLCVNLLAITLGFVVVLTVSMLVLSLISSIVSSKVANMAAEIILGWPIAILLMYKLLKFVEKVWFSEYKINTNIYMLVPTLEACLIYALIYFARGNELIQSLSDYSLTTMYLFIVGFFVLVYIINVINYMLEKRKK